MKNFIDFSEPNGFPLEADSTLGFMQDAYYTALLGLARVHCGQNENVILSGCELLQNGQIVNEGWVWLDQSLLFFQGGFLNDGDFYVFESVESRPNFNGDVIDRYTTKYCKLGDSPTATTQYNFANLKRVPKPNYNFDNVISNLCFQENAILAGCNVTLNSSSGLIDAITDGLVVLGGIVRLIEPYSPAAPVAAAYLVLDTNGQAVWQDSLVGAITFIDFLPHVTQYFQDIVVRRSCTIGEIKAFVDSPAEFDATGLGYGRMFGFAKCNGFNNTPDLSNTTAGLTYVIRIP
jgi:hypothetical protein